MPFQSKDDLPEDVQDALPEHAQKIYLSAYNSAYEQYADEDDREATAHRVAWSAVKDEYKKNNDGEWVKED